MYIIHEGECGIYRGDIIEDKASWRMFSKRITNVRVNLGLGDRSV
jgi:hypothetical protein